MTNQQLAATLIEFADLLEGGGENVYKVQAYRRGAKTIAELESSAEAIYRQDGLTGLKALPNIGDSLAEAVAELVETGHLGALEHLRRDTKPEGQDGLPF